MRAAVTVAPERMRVEEVPDATARPGEALVAVEQVGLCGSDLHLYLGDHPYSTFPNVQGHEFSAVVLTLPDGYDGPARVGDRVAVEPLRPCGRCFPCRRGRGNCCVHLEVLGAHVPGALQERLSVRAAALHPVGDLPPDLTALVEPVAIGLQAVDRAGIAAGDRVVVVGAGPIGAAVLLGARDRGARVLVADLLASRLELAGALGADRTVRSGAEDLAAAVADWTGGDGAAAVVDATGVPAVIRAAVDYVAPSGTICIVGISPHDVALPVPAFTRKELTVVGSRNNAGLFGEAVALVRRHRAEVGRLVTHRFPLDRAPEALVFALEHPEVAEKVLVEVAPS